MLNMAMLGIYITLEPQTSIYKWMFGETTIFYIKVWNHSIETSIYKWLFGVPGLGGGFQHFLFSPPFGEDEPILTSIFFKGVETTN